MAEFLGAANLIAARRTGPREVETPLGRLVLGEAPSWEAGTIAIRPERIRIAAPEGAPDATNRVRVTVADAVFRGDHVDVQAEPGPLRVRLAPAVALERGATFDLTLPAEHLRALDD